MNIHADSYRTTRTLTRQECPWLDQEIAKGTVLYAYSGATYGCISRGGRAMTTVPDETPFFEVPADALEQIQV